MKVVVIGGHTRNIGKTSVMSAMIREFSSFAWTAVKITQYGHGVCSHDGQPCGCAPTEHPFALTEETDAQGRADTCRYLAAGARQSLWLRARQGQLASALPLLYRRLRGSEWVIIESNSILEFVEPVLYLVVLDGSRRDFKPSAQRSLARANSFISVSAWASARTASQNLASGNCASLEASLWHDLGLAHHFSAKPIFSTEAPHYWSAALAEFVRHKLDECTAKSSVAAAVTASSIHPAG